jgi:hypothetical protein
MKLNDGSWSLRDLHRAAGARLLVAIELTQVVFDYETLGQLAMKMHYHNYKKNR